MTYIIVLYGDDGRLLANANCRAGVLRDWLLTQLRHSLPKSPVGGCQVDLCAADGGLRLLSALPATCRGLDTLSSGVTYRAVVRTGEPAALFTWLGGGQTDPQLSARLVRDQLAWELAKLRLPEDAAPELVLQTVQQVLASAGSSSASGLIRQLARALKEGRCSERLTALEWALGAQKRVQQAVQSMKQRANSKGRSQASNRAASAKSQRSTSPS